jgi:hypothetical protein
LQAVVEAPIPQVQVRVEQVVLVIYLLVLQVQLVQV